jgi:hypothetical protein
MPTKAVRDCEQRLFSACRYLIDNVELDLAQELANCRIHDYIVERKYTSIDDDHGYVRLDITLQTTKTMYKIVSEWNSAFYETYEDYVAAGKSSPDLNALKGGHIHSAFTAVFSDQDYLELKITPVYGSVEYNQDWRITLFAAETSEVYNNQNPYSKEPIVWKGMRFNSPPEIEIAKALDEIGVMYFPNCLVRAGTPKNRVNRFHDFLICYKGKWGVLEIDGKTYHTGRAADDYDRMRLLNQHGGIDYFDRYDAMRCQNSPKEVVAEFLKILEIK